MLVAGGGTLTFTDSAITSAATQPINGCQNGIGIRAGVPGTTPAEPGHLIMRDSSVSGYDKGGVVVSATGTTLRGNDMGVYDTPGTSVATPRQPGAVLAEDSFTGNRYEGVVLDQGNASVDASVFSGGNVGIEVLQYNGQVLRNAETASLDRFRGLSTASVDVLSDQATSGDLPGSFQISLSGTHSAPVLDNSANVPVIQRADY